MRRLGYLLLIVLCAQHCSLGATLEDAPVPVPVPGSISKGSEPNRHPGSANPDSMLREAVERMDLGGVHSALSKGANPNHVESLPFVRSSLLRDALIYSCFRPAGAHDRETAQTASLQILRALFDAGAKIQPVDSLILELPILAGYRDVVALLLSKGAYAKGKSEEGLSWVELSEARGQREIAELLVKHGGDPISSQDAAQLRYLQALRESSFLRTEKALRDGASANDGYKSRDVPLCELFQYPTYDCEHYAILLFLLKRGVNVNTSSQNTRERRAGTPLHVAIASSSIIFDRASGEDATQRVRDAAVFARLALKALLEGGAHVAARDTNGRTPLHTAAKVNNLVGAELLLKAGSTVMPQDDAGKTPLDYAESAEMIKLLEDSGARE